MRNGRGIHLRSAVLLLVMSTPIAWAADAPGNGRRPPPDPNPRSQAIPELVCTGDRAVDIVNDGLETKTEESPLRLRLRGNLLYIGQTSVSEKFFGLINRSDRRRWNSGNATLVLDEDLTHGVWVRLSLTSTRVSAVRCQPFSAARG